MNEGLLMDIMKLTMTTSAWLCAPLVITVVVVGLVTQVLQSVTQLKDQSLTFVPKIFITGVVFVLAIPWYIQIVQNYCDVIFNLLEKAAQ
jgi:flagellar biosynthesis protein FliQ